MIPISLRVRGLTVLKDVQVIFNDIPGDIIAITGKNGQGKTSLMEAVFMSLYRALPSRPAGTYKYFHGRDSLVDFKFDWQGKVFEALINIDSVYEKMEAFLYDEHQNPVKGITGKTKDYDVTIEKIFGSSNLILASSFAAQTKKGSFTSLPKVDRKDLFIRMLNLEILQRISKEAVIEMNKCDADLRSNRDALSVIRDRIKQAIIPDIDELQAQISILEADHESYKKESRRLLQKVSELRTIAGGWKGIQDRVEEEKRKISEYAKRRLYLQERLRQNQQTIDKAPPMDNIDEQLTKLRDEAHRLRTEISRLHGVRRDLAQHKAGFDEATAKFRQEWLVENSALKLAKAAKESAEKDASIIDQVPCKAEGEFASCQFLVNAIEKRESMDALEVEIVHKTQAMLKIQDEQSQLSKVQTGALENCDKQIKDSEAAANAVHAEITKLEILTTLSAAVEQAKIIISEVNHQIEIVNKSYADATTALMAAQIEYESASNSLKEVQSVERQLVVTEEAAVNTGKKIDSLRSQIATAEATKAWVTESSREEYRLENINRVLETDRREWDLLARAFGPMGIQSLEIDAAGPTVSSLTNDLLFSCFGPRFSIKFLTQVLKADGAGYKDEFDINVIDADNGRDGSIDDLSGGEKVVVGEAVGLAISIFNKMKSGVAWQSLFRDEVSGALDDDAAQKYIAMLRRAREIGHFVKVYFIAHQPRLHDLSDARINMVNGIAEIIA